MSRIIGIDPGLSGGIAILSGCNIDAIKMPDTDGDILSHFQWMMAGALPIDAVAFIEKVSAGPRMGSSAAFKFGRNNGVLAAMCAAFGVRIEFVSPQKWQREFSLIVRGRGLGQDDAAKKNRNKAKAQELFPGMKITHAIADALLIAEYGRRELSRRAAAT